jgi:hypothetical protein
LAEFTYQPAPVVKGYSNQTLYINLDDNTIRAKPVTEQMNLAGWDTEVIPVDRAEVAMAKMEKAMAEAAAKSGWPKPRISSGTAAGLPSTPSAIRLSASGWPAFIPSSSSRLAERPPARASGTTTGR